MNVSAGNGNSGTVSIFIKREVLRIWCTFLDSKAKNNPANKDDSKQIFIILAVKHGD